MVWNLKSRRTIQPAIRAASVFCLKGNIVSNTLSVPVFLISNAKEVLSVGHTLSEISGEPYEMTCRRSFVRSLDAMTRSVYQFLHSYIHTNSSNTVLDIKEQNESSSR